MRRLKPDILRISSGHAITVRTPANGRTHRGPMKPLSVSTVRRVPDPSGENVQIASVGE
jgi:hypothetical protein